MRYIDNKDSGCVTGCMRGWVESLVAVLAGKLQGLRQRKCGTVRSSGNHLLSNTHHRAQVGTKDCVTLLCVTKGVLHAHLVAKRAQLLVAVDATLPKTEQLHARSLTAKGALGTCECALHARELLSNS